MVISPQTVVVANSTARLRTVLVVIEHVECQVCQFSEIFFDVQNVWVEVKIFVAVGIHFQKLFEVVYSHLIFLRLVATMGYLVFNEDRLRKISVKSCIQGYASFFLLNVEEEARKVKIQHPVIFQLVEHVSLRLAKQWA